jgi:hypothetical protein
MAKPETFNLDRADHKAVALRSVGSNTHGCHWDTDTDQVFLVSCVSKKRSVASRAKELYVSDWFQKARSFVERTGCPWFILSAEHGLVGPEVMISPYNKTLNTMPVNERRAWAATVLQQIRAALPDAKRIAFLAGRRYREFLIDELRSRHVEITVPMEGLRIGEQLRWLART